MSAPCFQAVLVAFAISFHPAQSYSNGKVTDVCKSMKPSHHSSPSTKDPPYTLTVDKETFTLGDDITVTLSGTKPFKGFLLEVRDAGNPDGDAVGSFSLADPRTSQLLKCGDTQASAVSHSSDVRKTQIRATWSAPLAPPPCVQFLVTVVHDYTDFWVKIPGPLLCPNGVTAAQVQSTASLMPTTLPNYLPVPFSSVHCGKRKSCLRDPADCDPSSDPQCFFLSFTTEGMTVLFELSGPADGYVSFALSLDKWMGDDDVYLCVKNRERVEIREAYVKGRTHPELARESMLSDMEWNLTDGVIRCRFRRNISAPRDIKRFNLNSSYYLFMAHGPVEDGIVHRHHRQPVISTELKVISGAPENLSGSRSSLLMKFHGAFMLIAWTTAVSTGIIIARYFKHDWSDKTLFGQRVWFQLHRALMLVSVLLTSVGFMLPFIYRGGWSRRAGTHPYLGCIVMALSVSQPLVAVLRPNPDSSRRWMFNWIHLSAGTIAEIIAVVAIFLGIHQQALLLPGPWSTGVLALSVVWGVAAHLLLEFHSKGIFKIGKDNSGDEEAILPDQGSSTGGSQFRKLLLGVFFSGKVILLVVLLHAIHNV